MWKGYIRACIINICIIALRVPLPRCNPNPQKSLNRFLSRLAPLGALAIMLVGCDVVPVVAPHAHEQDPANKAPFAIQLSDTLPSVRKGGGSFNALVIPQPNTMDPSLQEAIRSNQSAPAGQAAVRTSGSVSNDLVTAPSLLPSPDLVWYSETGSATIWRMNGAAFAGTGATVLQIPSPWRMVAVGDMNNDSNPDLIWEDTNSGMRAVVFMVGAAYGGSYAMMIQIPAAWRVAAAADINGDGKTDLIIENASTGDHIVLYMNGAAYAGSQAPLLKTPLDYRLAAVADVNGDGKFDLIFENTTDGTRLVSMYNGAAYTGVTITAGVMPVAWSIGAAGDFNGDGQADFVIQNKTDGQRRILFMQGTTFTSYAVLPNVNPVINVIGAARFNWNPSGDRYVSDVAGLRAAVANAGPNSRVLIAAGTYDLGNTSLKLDGKNNFQLLGAGRGQTILKGGALAPIIVELAGVSTNVSVAHMTLEGPATLSMISYGLATGPNRYSLTGGRFFDLEVKNVSIGIEVDFSSVAACTDVEIVGNYLDNIQDFPNPSLGGTAGTGYGIVNNGCVETRIADNVIRNVDRHSIYQSKANQGDWPGFGKIVIEHNLIIDANKTASVNNISLVALVVARSANVVVANNIIVNPYSVALSIENEAINTPQWNVYDVRLINNTVIGTRDADVYFSASGAFTFWGNRFYHRDAIGPTAPIVRRAGYGFSGTLVEPSTLTGTQAMAAAPPFGNTFAFRTGVVQKLTNAYNTDPATWALANSPFLITGFEDMAAAPGYVYVMANGKLTEVNTSTWAHRDGPVTFPAASMVGYSDGNLAAISNGQIYRLSVGTLDGTAAALPGSGPVRGMAMFGDKTYILSGSCTYEIKTSDLTTVSSAC
jgi:hypothetical protein